MKKLLLGNAAVARGAYEAGWRVVFFNRYGKRLPDGVKADAEICSLRELLPLV